jgi:hypothetical protein
MGYLMPVRHTSLDGLRVAAQELDRGPIMYGRVWDITKAASRGPPQDCAQAGINPTQEQIPVLLFQEQTVGSGRSVMFQIEHQSVVNIT